MKNKILFGLVSFVIAAYLFFNVSVNSSPSNNLRLEAITKLAVAEGESQSSICYWWADDIGYGSLIFCDCLDCSFRSGENPRFQGTCGID